MHGTVRAQNHLKEVLRGMGVLVVPKPEVYVGKVNEKFDAEGRLVDEDTRKLLRELLAATCSLARTLRGG
jgi:chromate reductase